jgi:tungstate transport system substrate-binding protein
MPSRPAGAGLSGATSTLVASLLFFVHGCGGGGAGAPVTVTLASTTSTEDSGLFDELIPAFREAHPEIRVRVVAVGSGQALELGRRGDADVLLVHSPEAELTFMAEGHGLERRPVMYNDFVMVGPPADPAGVQQAVDAAAAFRAVARAGSGFISRGDDSGTHQRELALWRHAGLNPPPRPHRLEAGQGMAETLAMASELGMYTLTDRGTFLALQASLRLEILHQGGADLANPYHVIIATGARDGAAARTLAHWLLSPAAAGVISRLGVERFGQPLFHPGSPPR